MKKLKADELRECLLLFVPESFVFQFAAQKYDYYPLGTALPLYRTGVSLLSRESFLYI